MASKRKGVSAEEKRTRMLQLFYEKKEVFQLKELEKIAPKEKGIVSQSVKEVVQSLVDDGLVDTDKIGTSVYFWAFPSKAANNRKVKIDELNEKLHVNSKKLKALETQKQSAQNGREETEERAHLIQLLAEKEDQLSGLKTELQKYKEFDPQVLEELQQQSEVAKDGANLWTDNVFALKSWCQKKFFVESSVLNKQFGIPEEFDYVE